jgi:hypothetical protein
MKTTHKFSPDDITNIISDWFSKHRKQKIKKVEFILKEETKGFGVGEYQEIIFDGVKVTIKEIKEIL